MDAAEDYPKMMDSFYRAFEDRHRGPRDLIKERLQIYLPFIKPLLDIYPEGSAIDVGCGRGEWLELLSEAGFKPTGADLDEGMLQACAILNLSAVQADALEFLASTESSTQLVVSAVHVVEHVSFEQLRVFVSEALRVLKPGGFLIMETPNPENIVVATRNFYLDPTHKRPLPPQLLSFVAEFSGFERVKTLRLQEPEEIRSCEDIGLTDVINCVSPDYAIVAQKTGDASIQALSQALFAADYGVSLDGLTQRLDQRLDRMEVQSKHALELAQQAEAKAQQAYIAAGQHMAQLQSVYASRSWRVTAPLRWTFAQVKRFRAEGLNSRIKALIKKALRKINHGLLLRPALRQRVLYWSHKLGLYAKLKLLLAKTQGQHQSIYSSTQYFENQPADLQNLSPRVRQIYADLKQAIERQKKENY